MRSLSILTLGLGIAMSHTTNAQMVSELPTLTVYPSPSELLIDRLSRKIIDEIPLVVSLPQLTLQEWALNADILCNVAYVSLMRADPVST